MGKKKREHVVFDQMLIPKKKIPFSMVNKQNTKGKKKNNRSFYGKDKNTYANVWLHDELGRAHLQMQLLQSI